jgi:zinc transport system substrate-binding protein
MRPSEATPTVFVSIVPQKYFVDRISGGLVNCLVMVPPGTNVHTFEPRPGQMTILSTAKAYLAIGLEFEGSWLPKFAAVAPAMRIVHTDATVPKITSEDSDEPTATGSTLGLDPHIWLSPRLVKLQAASIATALASIDTCHAIEYTKNLTAFLADVDSLDRQLRKLLPCNGVTAHAPQKAFLVFHPTWAYFAKEYCLRQVSIEVAGKEPSPRTMKAIVDTARAYGIRTVFVQPEFSRASALVIAHELGARVLDADALAYDWKNTLLSVAQRIAEQ